jgi:hypothetical protein
VKSVPVLRVDDFTDELPDLLAGCGVPVGRPVMVIVGGAGGMAPTAIATFRTLLKLVVVPVVEQFGAVVIDGGTDSGVMRSVGRVRAATGARFPLVGVAVAATVVDGGEQVIDDAAEIEPNHSLVVLVPGSGWGEEVTWISGIASALAQGSPSVTVLVNGGEIAYDDVAVSLTQARPVLVLAGSGRTADAIAAARSGGSADSRAVAAASSDLTAITQMDDIDAVRAALEHMLSAPGVSPSQSPPLDHITVAGEDSDGTHHVCARDREQA